MLEVLGRATSGNVQKVLFLLEELGAPQAPRLRQDLRGHHAHPAIPAINPTQKVPTLRDGELHVWESHTILRYVANKQEAHALYPRDPAARSRSSAGWTGRWPRSTWPTPASRKPSCRPSN